MMFHITGIFHITGEYVNKLYIIAAALTLATFTYINNSHAAALRAGQAVILPGTHSVDVTFNYALPDNNYAVSTQVVDAIELDNDMSCQYINVINKTSYGFTIKFAYCYSSGWGNGTYALHNVKIDWIVERYHDSPPGSILCFPIGNGYVMCPTE